MVAIAVENAKLLYDSQQQMRELQAIHHVSQAVTSSLQKETVLRTIVTAAGRVAGSDHTSIVLVSESGELEISFEEPIILPLLHERARPNGVTYQVLTTRQSRFHPRYGADITKPCCDWTQCCGSVMRSALLCWGANYCAGSGARRALRP